MMKCNITVPPIYKPIFTNGHKYRHIVLYGGRGSGKSTAAARYLILKSLEHSDITILCTREYLKSIKDSVHSLLKSEIYTLKLEHYFTITETAITSLTGCKFIYAGLKSNIDNIKSIPNIRFAWQEESSCISEDSITKLIPTIRMHDSQLIWSYNPEYHTDPVHQKFLVNSTDNTLIIKSSYRDNPYFSDTAEKERLNDKKNMDKSTYEWTYEGKLRPKLKGLIYKLSEENFININEFNNLDRQHAQIVMGVDFGWSHSFALCILMITKDYFIIVDTFKQTHLNTVEQVNMIKKYATKYKCKNIYADSANPEIIDSAITAGLPVTAVKKGPGSVEYGIGTVQSLIKDNKLKLIRSRTKELVDEVDAYVWLDNGKPINVFDDLLASLRYLVVSTTTVQDYIKEEVRKKNIIFSPVTHDIFTFFDTSTEQGRNDKQRAMEAFNLNDYGNELEDQDRSTFR